MEDVQGYHHIKCLPILVAETEVRTAPGRALRSQESSITLGLRCEGQKEVAKYFRKQYRTRKSNRVPYQIREYTPGDEQHISDLFSQVFSASLTPEQWQWKYRGLISTPPPSKLAFDVAGRLIGHAGAVPLMGQARGTPIPWYQIADVMVHPQARGHLGAENLFTCLLRGLLTDLARRHPRVLAYGFPGNRPFLLGERTQVYARVEQAEELSWRAGELHPANWVRVVPLDWSHARLDHLWQRRQPQLPLSLVRDRAYLKWRYAHNPFRSYKLLGLRILGRLAGWAVVTTQRSNRGWECLISDLLVPRRWLLSALSALDMWARDHDQWVLRLWLPTGWRAGVPLPRVGTPVVVTNMRWGLPWRTEVVRHDLYYTMGDVDVF